MSHEVTSYGMMRIVIGNRSIEFSADSIKPESREWLGGSLEAQIADLIDIRVREALEAHKRALRGLLGVPEVGKRW